MGAHVRRHAKRALSSPVDVLAATAVVLSGCAGDDGAGVRGTSVSEAGSGSASTGSGSASGLAEQDLSATTDDAAVQAAVADYQTYVRGEATALVPDVRRFTDAVRTGDTAVAKAAYAPSRVRWERIEPIASLVEELDGKLDARVDDFAGPADPAFTGWHRIEYLLWEKGDIKAAKPFADRLDRDVATLNRELGALEIPVPAVALGAGELVEEVSKARSPVRRTATPTPTCGTSPPTSTERRRSWRLSRRCSRSVTPSCSRPPGPRSPLSRPASRRTDAARAGRPTPSSATRTATS